MKKLLESKALLSSNVFHTNPLNFPKKLKLFNSKDLKLSQFGSSGILFVLAHNIKLFKEEFSHMTPAAKGLLAISNFCYFELLLFPSRVQDNVNNCTNLLLAHLRT